MGTVYEVEADFEGETRRAAVKLAVASDCGRPAAQLRHERAVLAEINHDSIVGLVDAGEYTDGRPYLVLELIDGVPITAWAWNLSLRNRLALFRSVCNAVAAVHERGVVHCDLKPSNVLVTPDGEVKLVDFGIARRVGDVPPALNGRDPVLTPEFASPEQMLGEVISPATDVYTLGLLLHEILCGRRNRLPWGLSGGSDTPLSCMPTRYADGEWGLALTEQAVGSMPSCSAVFGGVSAERVTLDSRVEGVLRTALQPEPASRYVSAADLARAVEQLLLVASDLPSPSRSSSPPYEPRPSDLCASS
jgi:serine/threonine protein kinase